MKFYVVRNIRFLLWRSALCSAAILACLIKHTAFFAAPHNFVSEMQEPYCGNACDVRSEQWLGTDGVRIRAAPKIGKLVRQHGRTIE